MHGDLEDLAEALERTGWAAELCDADWRLVWASSQLRLLLKASDDEELGIGLHLLRSRDRAAWHRVTGPAARAAWVAENLPLMLADDPAGRDSLLAEARALFGIERCEPAPALPVWTGEVESLGTEVSLGRARYFGARIRDEEGEAVGTIFIYGSTLPAALLALVARGDRRQFERMARLVDPGSHQAAILFADVQASGDLSRHLSSRAYFELVSDLWSAGDDAVVQNCGLVGKHAGDGFTAFFLVDDLGSASRSAAAAIGSAHRLVDIAEQVAARLAGSGQELRLNVGLHWGPSLFMGQIVTGGRLEVTALGDEVNEAARIQHAARGGTILASKALVEHLDPEDADGCGVQPAELAYELLAELPHADAKDVRDAGRIPVTVLRANDARRPA